MNAAGLEDCNASTSPKLDKADMPGDGDVKGRHDCQSTIQWMCKRLQNATSKAGRQIVKLETFLPVDGLLDKIYAEGDSECACEDLDRRSHGGGAVAGGECVMHTLYSHVLSSGEAKIMETTEVLKEVMLLQHTLMFIVLVSVDASVVSQFVFKNGSVEMKHLELCQLWLQDLHESGIFSISKILRTENEAAVLTHFSKCCGTSIVSRKVRFVSIKLCRLFSHHGAEYCC